MALQTLNNGRPIYETTEAMRIVNNFNGLILNKKKKRRPPQKTSEIVQFSSRRLTLPQGSKP